MTSADYLAEMTSKEIPSAPVYLAMLNDRLRALGTSFTELVQSAEGRRELCRLDPLLFPVIYLPHMVTTSLPTASGKPVDRITFADLHLELARSARQWAEPLYSPEGPREVVVAARGTGKSAWLCRILPLWAAAYGHGSRRQGEPPFLVLFGATNDAVQRNFGALLDELDTNELLRADFPHLTEVIKVPAADYATKSGLIIKTYSTQSRSTRGLNLKNRRPTLLVLDDIEVDGMSPDLVEKVVSWLRKVIPGLETAARILIAGTTAVHGGPVHQLLQELQDGAEHTPAEVLEWTRFYKRTWIRALIDDPSSPGGIRSHWPLAKPVGWLKRMREEDPWVFSLEHDNLPVAVKGRLWDVSKIERVQPGECEFLLTWLTVDPAKKGDKRQSEKRRNHDYSAYVVASLTVDGRVVIRYAHRDKAVPGTERARVITEIYERYPEITWCWVEGNAVGDLIFMELESLMAFMQIDASEVQSVITGSKEARIARAAQWYVRRRVVHEGTQHTLERELGAWPAIAHDDLPDALALAVLWALEVYLPRLQMPSEPHVQRY